MTVEEQKEMADYVLRKLSKQYDVLLAGGAPRDWYFDKPAKDLDFFVAGKPSKEDLQSTLDCVIEPAAGDDKYVDATFTTYNVELGGHNLQIMSCEEDAAIDVVNRFPASLCWAWYDGECHYDPMFELSVRYRKVLVPENIGYPPYLDKLMDKFPRYYACFGKEDFLREIGKKKRRINEVPLDIFDDIGGEGQVAF